MVKLKKVPQDLLQFHLSIDIMTRHCYRCSIHVNSILLLSVVFRVSNGSPLLQACSRESVVCTKYQKRTVADLRDAERTNNNHASTPIDWPQFQAGGKGNNIVWGDISFGTGNFLTRNQISSRLTLAWFLSFSPILIILRVLILILYARFCRVESRAWILFR